MHYHILNIHSHSHLYSLLYKTYTTVKRKIIHSFDPFHWIILCKVNISLVFVQTSTCMSFYVPSYMYKHNTFSHSDVPPPCKRWPIFGRFRITLFIVFHLSFSWICSMFDGSSFHCCCHVVSSRVPFGKMGQIRAGVHIEYMGSPLNMYIVYSASLYHRHHYNATMNNNNRKIKFKALDPESW